VKQHALGFQASRGEGVSYPPPKQPHLLTPRPPTAASEEDQPQAHVGGRKRGGFGGAATTARLPALPAHGKGRPRRGNVINDFDSENASGGGQRGGRRARSSGGEDGDVSPSASSSVSPSRARSSSPSRSPSRDGRALGARSKRSSGYGPGGGYDVRSPSSKYALVPKGKKTGGTTTTAAGDATAGTDATTTDPAGAPPAPAASPPAVPEVQPSKITFWPDFATVLLLLDPAAVPLEDTQQSKPDEPAAGGQSEKDALYEDLQKQLAGVFGDLARPSSLATSGLLSARPAADTRRWTYAALVRPSRKGAVRIKIEDARKATRGEEQQGEGEREDEAQKTAASAEVGGNHAASASDDTVPSEHATDAAETATTLSAQENELEA
jgi:hypothetical protein